MIFGTEYRLVLILGIATQSIFKQEPIKCKTELIFLLFAHGKLIFHLILMFFNSFLMKLPFRKMHWYSRSFIFYPILMHFFFLEFIGPRLSGSLWTGFLSLVRLWRLNQPKLAIRSQIPKRGFKRDPNSHNSEVYRIFICHPILMPFFLCTDW